MTTLNRKTKPRWHQFSLRACIVFTTVVSTLFAFLSYRDAQRRQLISDIRTAGGAVEFDDSLFTLFDSSRVRRVTLPQKRLADVGTSRLRSLVNLAEVSVTDVQLTQPNGGLFATPLLSFPVPTTDQLDELVKRFPAKERSR